MKDKLNLFPCCCFMRPINYYKSIMLLDIFLMIFCGFISFMVLYDKVWYGLFRIIFIIMSFFYSGISLIALIIFGSKKRTDTKFHEFFFKVRKFLYGIYLVALLVFLIVFWSNEDSDDTTKLKLTVLFYFYYFFLFVCSFVLFLTSLVGIEKKKD